MDLESFKLEAVDSPFASEDWCSYSTGIVVFFAVVVAMSVPTVERRERVYSTNFYVLASGTTFCRTRSSPCKSVSSHVSTTADMSVRCM